MLKSNLKISLSQIWVICHLLPFVRIWLTNVGPTEMQHLISSGISILFMKIQSMANSKYVSLPSE